MPKARSAITGKYTTKEDAAKHPQTTVVEGAKPKAKKQRRG